MGPFGFDRDRASAAIDDPAHSLIALSASADTDQLRDLIDAAQVAGAITRSDERWALVVYPLSSTGPGSTLGISEGGMRFTMSALFDLGQEDGEADRDFTLRLIQEVVADANSLVDPAGTARNIPIARVVFRGGPVVRNALIGPRLLPGVR